MKKIEYKLNTKKGQTVYLVAVNIRSEEDRNNPTSFYPEGITVTELKIVHQTKYKTVLSDDLVTVLDRQQDGSKKDSYHSYLDNVMVSIKTKENYFPNGIFSSCYSLEDPNKCVSRIKAQIINKINKEYGFLRNINIEEVISNYQITNK